MGPIDYTQGILNPVQAALQGYQGGMAIRNDMQAQQDRELKMQQEQAAIQAQQRMNADLFAASNDMSQIPGLMVRYPQLADKLKHGFEAMSAEQQQSAMREGGEVLAALQAGRPDIAVSTLKRRSEALRNSGDEQGAKAADDMAQWAEQDPASFKTSTALRLAALPGGDKLITSIIAMDKAPVELRKAEADATTAEVTAANAGTAAELANEDRASQIRARQTDAQIKRDELRIKTMEAAMGRETNDLKRQELQLKIDEAKAAVESRKRTSSEQAQGRMSEIQGSLDLLSNILGDEDTLRAAVGTSAWRGAIPGSKARSMAGKVEQLQNSIAAVNLDKLKGAMSDKDILFLKNIGSNLDRYQDEELFISELKRIEGVMRKAQATEVAAGRLPTSGGAFVMKHPQFGNVTEGNVNDLLSKFPGSTREQVLEYLRSTGGK